MAITVADFRLRFPEFCDELAYPDARIQVFIDSGICTMGHDENHWNKGCGGQCNCYDEALSYLAAHKLILATITESGDFTPLKSVNSAAAEGVSVVFGAEFLGDINLTDRTYLATGYGAEFINLRNQCFPPVAWTGCL